MTSHTNTKISPPTDHSETPESVQSDRNLNRDEKTKVLQLMALDADQLLVTTSEGMLGASPRPSVCLGSARESPRASSRL